ncbi:peptidylprolyl isomerase [Candidatus Formimonas warabiya]|nr:peptidylprolyl isomerase [Candidatus Formimonas warabiya]
MRRRMIGGLVILLSLVLLSGCGPKPVAVVNGEKISQERFDRYFAQLKAYAEQMGTSFEGDEGKKQLASLKQEALDGIIDETLVFQAAKKEGIKVTPEEIDQYLNERVKSSFESDQKFQDWLKSLNMTEQEFKQKIEYQQTGQKLFDKVTAKISVSDEAAREYYEKDKASWEKIKVSHILISAERDKVSKEDLEKAKKKAQSVITELDQGGDFAELAKKYSEDPGSASQGGLLDMEFTKNEQGLVPEFVEGSFKLTKVGEYSKEPVLSEFGYHIIKLDEKKGSFEDVKADVKNQLVQTDKNQAFTKYMDDLKKEAKITKNLPQE